MPHGKMISVLHKMGEKIVVFLHIYRVRANFLLFCDHQDTESELCEIEMIIYQPITTNKNIFKALLDNDIHTLQDRRKLLWHFFIFMVVYIFPIIL